MTPFFKTDLILENVKEHLVQEQDYGLCGLTSHLQINRKPKRTRPT